MDLVIIASILSRPKGEKSKDRMVGAVHLQSMSFCG